MISSWLGKNETDCFFFWKASSRKALCRKTVAQSRQKKIYPQQPPAHENAPALLGRMQRNTTVWTANVTISKFKHSVNRFIASFLTNFLYTALFLSKMMAKMPKQRSDSFQTRRRQMLPFSEEGDVIFWIINLETFLGTTFIERTLNWPLK